MVIDGQKGHNVRNYKFLAKYLFEYFQIFSIFILWKLADEILSIFQNLQTLWQRKSKNTHTAVNEREKKNWEKLDFYIRMTQEILLGMGNYKIYFKNTFNGLVMNVTKIDFIYWQNVHVWRLIKVNHKRSL